MSVITADTLLYYNTMQTKFSEMLRASFKSADTEEWLDVYFTRPIGLAFALLWARLGVHPNVITILSMFLGLGAGWMFYYTDLWHNIAGIILLMFANFCDSTDGQLARMTGKKTLVGRVLDGLASDVWFFAVYLGIVFRLFPQDIPFLPGVKWGWWALLLCAIAGLICHSMQCRLADYYRQIHLYFLLGKSNSEFDNYESQHAIYESLPKKGAFWARAFYGNYAKYCRAQEKSTPCFQQFYSNIKARYPEVGDMPQELRDDFRRGSLPLMKYTNLLTHNSRAITLFIGCLLNVPYIYPLFEIVVLSAIYWYMHRRHEALCVRLNEKYGR